MSENNPFLRALAMYTEAVYRKDVGAFAALYDQDIHVFDMWGTWSLSGLNAWRDMASAWFSSLGNERVVVTFDSQESTVTGELAIGHAMPCHSHLHCGST